MNTRANEVSELNNAMLPELREDGKVTFSSIDKYIRERIGLHDYAITQEMILNDALFNTLEHPLYTEGKDGYVFFHFENYNPGVVYVEKFCQYLRQIQDKCAEKNIPFIYCINPYKLSVYPEKAPDGFHYRPALLNDLYKYLDKYGVNYISTVELLRDKAEQGQQVYNIKFDAGHWNDLGQFYATNMLLEKVHEYFPSVAVNEFSDFEIKNVEKKYLYQSKFPINEVVPQFINMNQNVEIITNQFEKVLINKRFPQFECYRLEENRGIKPTVLFFHGSYYNRSEEFTKSSFYELYTVHNYYNLFNIDYYLDQFNPDCVILESAEYATNNNYFPLDLIDKRLSGDETIFTWD